MSHHRNQGKIQNIRKSTRSFELVTPVTRKKGKAEMLLAQNPSIEGEPCASSRILPKKPASSSFFSPSSTFDRLAHHFHHNARSFSAPRQPLMSLPLGALWRPGSAEWMEPWEPNPTWCSTSITFASLLIAHYRMTWRESCLLILLD